jgi:enamine deaminase RidA (YjgF/YER057c/UK114 family)
MRNIQRLEPATRYSNAVVYNGTAWLAGAAAQDLQGDIEQQTRETLADIDATLAKLGSDKSRLLSAQIWLRDIAGDFARMNAVWEAWLPSGCAPARATCEARMADPSMRIEIIVVAAV